MREAAFEKGEADKLLKIKARLGLGFREGFRALDFSGLAAVVGAFLFQLGGSALRLLGLSDVFRGLGLVWDASSHKCWMLTVDSGLEVERQ